MFESVSQQHSVSFGGIPKHNLNVAIDIFFRQFSDMHLLWQSKRIICKKLMNTYIAAGLVSQVPDVDSHFKEAADLLFELSDD